MEGRSAQEFKAPDQAAEESNLSPAYMVEAQKRSPGEPAEDDSLSEADTRTEKAIAVEIIHLFEKGDPTKNAERIRKVRMSELLEEIYLAYRRRTVDGLPLPHAGAIQDLSPDDEQLLERLALVGESNPETLYELERKIEDYGLKMGCESLNQVFAIWLSGS